MLSTYFLPNGIINKNEQGSEYDDGRNVSEKTWTTSGF